MLRAVLDNAAQFELAHGPVGLTVPVQDAAPLLIEDWLLGPEAMPGAYATEWVSVRHENARYKRNLLISCALFVAAMWLVYRPGLIDLPAIKLLNSYVSRNAVVDTVSYGLDTYFTFSGIILVAVLWSCWFKSADLETRARIVVGCLASVAAGGISRFLQHHLHTHIRPFYDTAIAFHRSPMLETAYNTWNSFPSDHAAVFAGLVVVTYIVRACLGKCMAGWLLLIQFSRCYMGAHYPSDLIGGAALASAAVWASQSPSIVSFGRRIASRERSSPSLFYTCAFCIMYQIGTLFLEIRRITNDFSSIVHPK